MEAMRSSETSVLTRAARRHIPEENILQNHRCGNLESYMEHLKICVMSELQVCHHQLMHSCEDMINSYVSY
jgi:hypothetical protein